MSGPVIALIVAVAKNGVIGRDGKLPWRIPEDMKWFRERTAGRPLIMGRKTWESFPKRPLPGRTNIVVTRNAAYQAEGAVVVPSFSDALEAARRESPEEIMVIGGAEIYQAAMPFAQRVYLTSVHSAFDGDTNLAVIDTEQWNVTEVGDFPSSAERPVGYSFIILDKK